MSKIGDNIADTSIESNEKVNKSIVYPYYLKINSYKLKAKLQLKQTKVPTSLESIVVGPHIIIAPINESIENNFS